MKLFITFLIFFVSLMIMGQDDYGYRIDGEDIVFKFDVRDYSMVTINDTQVKLDLSDINIKKVAVAGTFNKWAKNDWKLKNIKNGVYELRKKIKYLNTDSGASFKFVINDKFWVEPPTIAPNREQLTLDDIFVSVYNLKLNEVKESEDGNHTFYLHGYSNAQRVIVTGTFNNWDENEFELECKDGYWELTLDLPIGTHEYRYIVDGQWMRDPHNPKKKPNEYNEFNSVITKRKLQKFRLKNVDFKNVYLAGDFTDWQNNKLQMNLINGFWEIEIPLTRGVHHYKFIVDDIWIVDPMNNSVQYDKHDHVNSVILIK
ncbi:hypothetical protein AAT17_05165 [Nonlabens sp. MIC269]|nr:hypothetical protein AAT17_05165 [Nonlabens sp. MIC269]